MADNYIQLPADSTGKKLDTESLLVGANTVHRERDRISGSAAAELADVKASDPDAAHYGLVVRPIKTVSPVTDYRTSVNLAASASVDLDGTAIAAGATGKLMRVQVSSSVSCKWMIKTRDGGSEVTLAVLRTSGYGGKPTEEYTPPTKDFDTLAYVSGDENFRVTVTNNHTLAADVDATIQWDEVS